PGSKRASAVAEWWRSPGMPFLQSLAAGFLVFLLLAHVAVERSAPPEAKARRAREWMVQKPVPSEVASPQGRKSFYQRRPPPSRTSSDPLPPGAKAARFPAPRPPPIKPGRAPPAAREHLFQSR